MVQESPGLLRLQAAMVLAVVLGVHLSLAPNIADPDSFYHVGHAAHYAAHGPFDTSFPWATVSLIGDLGADLWWGFHVALIPCAVLGSVTDGIRAAAFLSTVLLAGAVWWVLHRHGVRGAGWWSAGFLLAVPNVLFRFAMVRPHVLSLALALLLLSFLTRGRSWQVLATSAAMVWLHLGMFWLPFGIAAAYALTAPLSRSGARQTRQTGERSVPVFAALGAVLAGTVLGALLRPHPLAAAELAWVQIVRLFAEKAAGRPLLFASELDPLPLLDLLRMAWSFLLAWLGAGLAVAWHSRAPASGVQAPAARPERRLAAASTLLAVAFLLLAVLSARRALVEFTVFGFLLLPLAWTFFFPRRLPRAALVALALVGAVHLGWATRRHLLNARFVATPPDAMAEVATWLSVNSEPGDVVFHAHWDNFGPLFARNRVNRYLGGMDPIFQYAHDPGLYWQYFFLSADATTEYTCDAFPCYEGEATDTWAAIARHFGARWVVVEPARNPKLTRFLEGNALFSAVLRTRREVVFEVLAPASPPPPARESPP